MDCLRRIVAGIPFNQNFPSWLEIPEIKFPEDLTIVPSSRRHNRFVVPTQYVARTLNPPLPEIGRLYDTNYVQYCGRIMPYQQAQDALLAIANMPPLPEVPFDQRDDDYYQRESDRALVRGAMSQSLEDLILQAIEIYIDVGDDGHTDFQLAGLGLVLQSYVNDVVKDLFHGEVTWV